MNDSNDTANDSNDAAGETFATYLAKYYVGRKGFSPGTVPEAAPLADACDIILTLMDGMTLKVICIVDCETHPQKTFGLSREELNQIGKECLKYTASISGTKMPVTFQIMEVGPEPVSEEDRQRLEALERESLASKVILKAWKLDTTSGTVWTNGDVGFLEKRSIKRLLREPRLADAEIMKPEVVFERERFPVVAVALLVVLAAIFVCELVYGVRPWSEMLAPNIETLVALGGLNRTLVQESGEWYRIFSATLLHGNAVHLAMNGFCLFLAGAMLENIVGRRWFFALFVVGGVCGSLLSLAVNPESVVSVGASGAIMGLLAAALVCGFHYPPGVLRAQIQTTSMQILIPSLIPLAVGRTGGQIDFAGHIGGALGGALVGLVLLKTWAPSRSRPAFMPAATALSVAGALALALSFLPLMRDYHKYVLDAQLIPQELLPKISDEISAKAANLVATYPRDPRARMFQAEALMQRADFAGAERELRKGLAEEELLATRFMPELAIRMKAMLALVLNELNRPIEAKPLAQPACVVASEDFVLIRDLLHKARLCEK
jgi:rhomboid protease GluP